MQNTNSVTSTSLTCKLTHIFEISSHLLMVEAEKRGWKTEIIDYKSSLVAFFPESENFYRANDATKIIFCQKNSTELNTSNGQMIARDKIITHAFAKYFGFHVPETLLYSPEENGFDDRLSDFLRKYRRLAVKPTDGRCGYGISTNVTDMESLRAAIDYAKQYSVNILLQSYVHGNDYRLLVLNGRVIAATWRRPACIIGDGERTIRQLVELKNTDPTRGKEAGKCRKIIHLNEVEAHLGIEQLENVPEKGVVVQVIGVANVSRGGESEDVTELVHESIRSLAVKIANTAQLSLCGVDLMIDGDISKPSDPDSEPILIEVNSAPMITLHHFPSCGGQGRNVAGAILDEIVRRRQFHANITTSQNSGENFAPILSNPEDFIPLSQGEKDYFAKIHT